MQDTPECGSHAAYLRHRRRHEDCATCKEGERVRSKEKRKAKREAEAAIFSEQSTALVEQKIRADQDPVILSVPTGTDPLESAYWRLAKVRGSMEVSTPRDMGPLAKREEEIIELIKTLQGAADAKPSVADELKAWRESRKTG